MGASGSQPAAMLVTREVRWFRQAPIPGRLVSWFTNCVRFDTEIRVDRYDLDAAHLGVGVKQRNLGSIDFKYRIRSDQAVKLVPGLTGHIEDWLKVTTTGTRSAPAVDGNHVEVVKEILTRRYPAGIDGSNAGCEAELASITMGDLEAWTLCFETFGDSNHRAPALGVGIAALLEETPLPVGFELGPGSSCGYPAWLSETSLEPV